MMQNIGNQYRNKNQSFAKGYNFSPKKKIPLSPPGSNMSFHPTVHLDSDKDEI